MNWDLYVDESGSFDGINASGNRERNIIGGFIIPHGIFSSKSGRWFREVRNAVVSEFGEDKIGHINRYNPRTVRTPSGDLEPREDYDFTHASCNKFVSGNQLTDSQEINKTLVRIQLKVLDEYRRRIIEKGGSIVIFDDPTVETYVDNLTTYLTIMGRGIVGLFNRLQLQYNDYAPNLYCHIAMRPNQMKDKEGNPVETTVLTLRGSSIRSVTREQYQNTIKYSAQNSVDDALWNMDAFQAIFRDDPRIVIEEDGQGEITIPCDFICNSFYRGAMHPRQWQTEVEYIRAFADPDHSILIPINRIKRLDMPDFIQMAVERSYFNMFLRLEAQGYPSERMSVFFEKLNEAPAFDQQTFTNQLVDTLKGPAKEAASKGTMIDLIARINAMLGVLTAEHIANEKTVCAIRSNLFLYLCAMYTHLGMDAEIKRVDQRFLDEWKNVNSHDYSTEELYVKYLNHRVVSCTDWFQYGQAEAISLRLSEYWEYRQLSASELFGREGTPRAEEYGRDIGSYLMLQRHRLRVSSVAYRQTAGAKLSQWYQKSIEQFSQKNDLNRCYLNISGTEAALGRYASAFQYLCLAAAMCDAADCPPITANDIIGEEQCNAIIQVCDCVNSEDDHAKAEPWVFYQYVRLAAELCAAEGERNNASARTMMQAMGRDALKGDTFDWIRNIFLKSILQWRAAELLIALDARLDIARVYMENAADSMGRGNSLPFKAISIAIRAEWIARLIVADDLKKASSHCEALKRTWKHFCALANEVSANNPFVKQNDNHALEGYSAPNYEDADNIRDILNGFESALKEKNPERRKALLDTVRRNLMRASRVIAY